jgi:hypothetical protein
MLNITTLSKYGTYQLSINSTSVEFFDFNEASCSKRRFFFLSQSVTSPHLIFIHLMREMLQFAKNF